MTYSHLKIIIFLIITVGLNMLTKMIVGQENT